MSLPNFEYVVPKSIAEVCSLVSRYRENCRVMAGGTDLLVRMKDRTILPQYLIDLKEIPGLDYIEFDAKEGLRIGALTTFKSVEGSPLIRERFSVIAQTAHLIGSVQIRNRATLCGNLCNASPAADMAPALIGLGARLKILSVKGERIVNLEDFFIGPYQTVLEKGEFVTEIQVPNMEAHTGGTYIKHTLRKAMDPTIVGVAVVIRLSLGNGKCEDVKIVLEAVSPISMRARRAEEILKGQVIQDALIERVAKEASTECSPRSKFDYKRELVKVFTKRAIREALKIAEAS